MSAAEAPAGKSTPARRRHLPKLDATAAIGLTIVALAAILAVFGPLLAPGSPTSLVTMPYAPPGDLLLGSDVLGRDLLSRFLHGAQLTMIVAVASTLIGFFFGVALGFVVAEVSGWVDDIGTWFMDVFLSFPPLLLGLIIIAALSPDLPVLIGAIAFLHVPRVARVSRAVALNVSTMQFVEAARVRGDGLVLILVREILPNTLRPLGVEFGLRLTYSILFAGGLSFLGLGIQPPEADWGAMVRENLDAFQLGVFLPVLVPAFGIAVTAIGINLVVDWLGSNRSWSIPKELK